MRIETLAKKGRYRVTVHTGVITTHEACTLRKEKRDGRTVGVLYDANDRAVAAVDAIDANRLAALPARRAYFVKEGP
jgi:hypothetical protein